MIETLWWWVTFVDSYGIGIFERSNNHEYGCNLYEYTCKLEMRRCFLIIFYVSHAATCEIRNRT